MAVENERAVMGMAEYIEREAAYEDFERCNSENPKWTPSRVKTLIARQKAADVAPVQHGRWINANSRPKTYERRCTACGGRAYFCGVGCSYKYCPNCGAKMDLEDER